MQLHAGGQQVGGGFVASLVGCREDLAAGTHHGFLAFHQILDHLVGGLGVVAVLDAGELGELGVRARSQVAQGADALGDLVHGGGQFGVLGLEHGVQRVELRAGDVPVVVVGLQVQAVGVCQQFGQALGHGFTLLVGHADVDAHD